MIRNNWDFFSQEICNVIVPVFSSPSSGPPFAWPGTDWDWIPQPCCLAPSRTYWICDSYRWAWLPPGWIGVVVSEWFGKEFPDMRQNERRIQFIRVGDTVRTAGQLKGEPKLNVEWGSLVHFYTQGTRSGIGVLQVIC